MQSESEVTNCILGRNAVIQSGVKLINCIIGDEMTITKQSDKPIKDETLSILDHQVEIVRKTSEYTE